MRSSAGKKSLRSFFAGYAIQRRRIILKQAAANHGQRLQAFTPKNYQPFFSTLSSPDLLTIDLLTLLIIDFFPASVACYRVYTFSSLYLQVYIEPRRRWNTDNHLAMVIHG
jgi:hypothetical protein